MRQGGVSYLLTDNSATRFKSDPNLAKTMEEVIEKVDKVLDYGTRIIPLEDDAFLAWGTVAPHDIGYIEKCVEKRGASSDPMVYADIPELVGFLLKGDDAWNFTDDGVQQLPAHAEDTLISLHCPPHMEGLVASTLHKYLSGVTQFDQLDPAVLRIMLMGFLKALNGICPVIGRKLFMVRVDPDGVKNV